MTKNLMLLIREKVGVFKTKKSKIDIVGMKGPNMSIGP